MESVLLKREDEFYRENEKLEKKTKELMKKVNDVMKIQDNLIKESLKTKTEISSVKINKFNLDYNSHPEYFEQTEDCIGNDEDIGIPNSVSQMGPKGASHFYRAKIKCLQADNIILHGANKKGDEEIKKLQKENQNLSDEKEKWFIQYNSAKGTIGKLEFQISSLNSKFQSRDNEAAVIKKELEQIKKELKRSNFIMTNFEVRLNRAYEENENLKASLRNSRDEEKELKDLYRKQINDLTTAVKHIDIHKTELLNGFQKQLQLIDNLKKQKMYLEGQKITEISESEYFKLLDLKLD